MTIPSADCTVADCDCPCDLPPTSPGTDASVLKPVRRGALFVSGGRAPKCIRSCLVHFISSDGNHCACMTDTTPGSHVGDSAPSDGAGGPRSSQAERTRPPPARRFKCSVATVTWLTVTPADNAVSDVPQVQSQGWHIAGSDVEVHQQQLEVPAGSDIKLIAARYQYILRTETGVCVLCACCVRVVCVLCACCVRIVCVLCMWQCSRTVAAWIRVP